MGRRKINDYERGSEALAVLHSLLSYGDNLHYEKFADGSVKCIEDEIPFDLPEGWAWSRIRDIASVKGGKRLPKGMSFSSCRTSHAYIRVTDMKNHSVNTDDLKYITEEVFLQIKNLLNF